MLFSLCRNAIRGDVPRRVKLLPWQCAATLLAALAICPAAAAEERQLGSAVRPTAPAAAQAEQGRRTRLDYAAVEPGLRIALAAPAPGRLEAPRARGGPVRIGLHRGLPARFRGDLARRFEWTAVAGGGVVASLTVASPGAAAIRAALLAQLPPRGEIRFFRPAEPERAFRVTAAGDFHIRPDGEMEPLWSPVIQGDAIGIEVTLPSRAAIAGFSLRLPKVSHRYARGTGSPLPPAAQCPGQLDVQCRIGRIPDGLQDAVVRVEFEEDGQALYCSATLLNNQLEDFAPYLITANHCISTPAAARSLIATWFFERPSCNSTAPAERGETTRGGTRLLATSVDQDATLLRLGQHVPIRATYSGWSSAALSHRTAVFGIHHPRGDYKKYSAGATTGNINAELVDVTPSQVTLNAIEVEWVEGLTEPGSSGSGLFERDHLIGVLSGSDGGCGGSDTYGNFADFHPKACPWLTPDDACAGRAIPLFLSASHPRRQGFARIVNHSDWDGEVQITAIDDAGERFGPVTLALRAGRTVHFNSDDLELGNRAKGLPRGVGSGQGDWRLELETSLNIEALAYVRTADGFVTTMHDVVPRVATESEHTYLVPFFNPGSNARQVSKLRLVNLGDRAANVRIMGRDDAGFQPAAGRLSLPPGTARTLTARQLEQGEGLNRGFGDRAGKWSLTVASDRAIQVMNLLEAPTGNLANLSSLGAGEAVDGTLWFPLFLPASSPGRHGFARVSNRTGERGTVTIQAADDTGRVFGPAELTLGPWQTAHFNSMDLEQGNLAKGLVGGLGAGVGDWQLILTTNLESVQGHAYVRTADGFVTSMADFVRRADGRHTVPTFNPGSNRDQQSRLRLINPGAGAVRVTIAAVDDAGAPGGEVRLTLGPARSRTLTAQELEVGHATLAGRLGDGAGKWRLSVTADQPIFVLSLLESPTGNLANLSTRTAP